MCYTKFSGKIGDDFDRQSYPSQLPSRTDLTVIQGLCAAALEFTESGDSKARPAHALPRQHPQCPRQIRANVIINSGPVVEHGCVLEDYVHVGARARLASGIRLGLGGFT